jgi:hypothetical protein
MNAIKILSRCALGAVLTVTAAGCSAEVQGGGTETNKDLSHGPPPAPPKGLESCGPNTIFGYVQNGTMNFSGGDYYEAGDRVAVYDFDSTHTNFQWTWATAYQNRTGVHIEGTIGSFCYDNYLLAVDYHKDGTSSTDSCETQAWNPCN